MFRLLDYETWNLYWEDEWVGQVTINSTDRDVAITLSEMGVDPHGILRVGNFARWVSWLKSHQRPRRH